ncbi:MAG TPA: tetratricopeptide repeat protein [Sphingomonas sp.]
MTMKLVKLGVPALLALGTTVAGGVAVASDRTAQDQAQVAAEHAARASKALGKRDGAAAVAWAEQAVAAAPRDASHRALLGRGYLQAGRFASAREALAEALALSPNDARTALNLVLAQIATGDWAEARRTLDAHAGSIPVSDRGLAVALTGDPASAVAMLTQAARAPEADVKTRQNLALSLALAGQWQLAKAVAAADMSPADVDGRMLEWAAFAQPKAASDQVAHLLGVRAAEDPGRPVALALNAPTQPVALAVAAPTSLAEAAPVAVASVEPSPSATSRIVFGPSVEVVQALPARLIRAASGAVKVALTARPEPIPGAKPEVAKQVAAKPATVKQVAAKPVVAPSLARGDWYVQLGAYDSPAVAQEAWTRASRRFAGFQGQAPTGVGFTTGQRSFYRLSVGGFARADAVSLCERYRAKGGTCFVRAGAGDRVAQWVKAPVRLASR